MKSANTAIAALLVSAVFSAEAIEVDVDSSAVRGVTIVSADIASDLEGSVQMLVVRLRNSADETGQSVTLAVTVRDENGQGRGMHAKQFEVGAAPNGEQVVFQPIPSFTNADDTLTVELVDVDEWAQASE